MMPTASRTIQELTQRPATMSVWLVAAWPSSVNPGRKPCSSVGVHPARTAAAAIPSGRTAQRIRRFEGTVHLSDHEQDSRQSRATAQAIQAIRSGLIVSQRRKKAGPGANRSAPDPPEKYRIVSDQWKLSPHAHDPAALGLSIVKPCSEMVSLKSIVAPSRYGTLMSSTITSTPSKSTVLSPSR